MTPSFRSDMVVLYCSCWRFVFGHLVRSAWNFTPIGLALMLYPSTLTSGVKQHQWVLVDTHGTLVEAMGGPFLHYLRLGGIVLSVINMRFVARFGGRSEPNNRNDKIIRSAVFLWACGHAFLLVGMA